MATEKQVMMRINATKNIKKITQSMKMVSAAKLRGDQMRLEVAKPYNVSCTSAVASRALSARPRGCDVFDRFEQTCVMLQGFPLVPVCAGRAKFLCYG